MIDYYFAYGSNMNPDRVIGRKMNFDFAEPGSLADYQLCFNKRSEKIPGMAAANVMRMSGAFVEGVIYRLTSPDEIRKMDPFEGYPHRYSRLSLPIVLSTGSINAWVYVANAAYVAEGLMPTRWYLNHLLAGRPFLSDKYFQQLSETPCHIDSATEPSR